MSHAPTTTSELLAVQDTLRAALCAAAEDRPARWGHVTLPGGNTVPAWVADAAKQMAAIVNEHRTRRGLDPASLEHILRVEASAAGHADYAHRGIRTCTRDTRTAPASRGTGTPPMLGTDGAANLRRQGAHPRHR